MKAVNGLSGFWKSVFRLSMGMLVAQVYAILAVPVITRLYYPEDYGVLGIFNAFSGAIFVIAAFRYEKAIIIASDEEVPSLLRLSAVFILVVSLLFYSVLLIGGEGILILLGVEGYPEFRYFLPISIFLNGFLLLILSLGNRRKVYRELAIAIAMQSIFSNTLKIVLGNVFLPDALFLIQAELFGITATVLFLISRLGIKHFFGEHSTDELITPYTVAKKYRKFFRYDVLNSLLSTSSWLLPVLIISYFFSATQAGFFVLAFSILRIPINLIGKSAEDVFYQQSSVITESQQLGINTSTVMWSFIRVGFLPMLLIVFFGDMIFTLVFGKGWEPAGQIARFLSPLIFFWLLSQPITSLFHTLQKQEKLVVFVILGTGLRIMALIIGGMFGNLYLSVFLFSIFSILIYILQISAAFSLTGYSVGLALKSELSESKTLFLISLCGTICIFFPLSEIFKVSLIMSAFCIYEIKVLSDEFKVVNRRKV